MAHFLQRVLHSQSDHLAAVRAPAGKAGEQLLFLGWHHEQVHRRDPYHSIRAGTHLRRALDIEIHHHVGSLLEPIRDLGFQCAVEISMDLGAFEELPAIALGDEFVPAQEMVVEAVHLARPWGTGGAGDRVVCLALVGKAPAERGFSGSGGAGDYEEDSCPLGHGSEAAWKTPVQETKIRRNLRGAQIRRVSLTEEASPGFVVACGDLLASYSLLEISIHRCVFQIPSNQNGRTSKSHHPPRIF